MNALDAYVAEHGDYRWEMSEVLRDLVFTRLGSAAGRETVVEIGTWRGDSLRLWREFLNPGLLIGIEPSDEMGPGAAAALGVELIHGKSQDAAVIARVRELLAGRPIDFLYVDGDHMYEAVVQDWANYTPLVRRPGGVVVLHDAVITWNPTVEVYRFWRELQDGSHPHGVGDGGLRTKLIYDGRHGSTGAGIVFF